MLMYAIAYEGCMDTIRVCTESQLEKNPLVHQGVELLQQHASPTFTSLATPLPQLKDARLVS